MLLGAFGCFWVLLGTFDMGAFGCSWVLLGKQSKSTNSTKQQKKRNGSIKNETTVSPAATRLNLRLYIIIIITGRERERERERVIIYNNGHKDRITAIE